MDAAQLRLVEAVLGLVKGSPRSTRIKRCPVVCVGPKQLSVGAQLPTRTKIV